MDSPYRASFKRPVTRVAPKQCNAIDTHELLKAEIYGQTYDEEVQQALNPASLGSGAAIAGSGSSGGGISGGGGGGGSSGGFEDTSFFFDSLTATRIGNTLKWSLPQQNNNTDISNIVAVKIFPFYFPRITGPAAQPDYFFYRKLFMRILSATTTQSVRGPNSNYFHYEFKVDNLNSIAVELLPAAESYYFTRPLTTFTELEIKFLISHNFQDVALPTDNLQVQSVFPGMVSPAQFTVTNGTTASIGPIGVPAAPGIAVYFLDYNSNSATTNNNVNDALGWYVVNIIDATNFTVAGIDTTATSGSYPATLIIPKNRIAFQMRFTSVSHTVTNYISIVHE